MRALLFMHVCRMSHTRNLSTRDSHSLVKLHVSSTVNTVCSMAAMFCLYDIVFVVTATCNSCKTFNWGA